MKYSLPILALALGLTACASDDRAPTFRGGAGGDAAYGRGLQALESGNVAQANEYFSCAAQFGGGFEVAWYYAGSTSLQLAAIDGPNAAEHQENGEYYLITSGHAGWGASQAALAEHYHILGNTEEAVYWAMLYTNNVREISLGLVRMDPDLIAAIRDNVSDEVFATTQARALRYVPEPIPVGRPSEDCNAAIQGDRERPTNPNANRPIRPQRTEAPGSRRRDPTQPY